MSLRQRSEWCIVLLWKTACSAALMNMHIVYWIHARAHEGQWSIQVSEETINESVPEEPVVDSPPLETSTSGSGLNGAEAAAEADGKPVRGSMQRKLTEALQPQQ